MSTNAPEFNAEEWAFVAAFALFDGPVEVDTAMAVAPLPPGRLLECLERAVALGWLEKYSARVFGLADPLPAEASRKIRDLNRPERLAEAYQRLDQAGAVRKLAPPYRYELLKSVGRHEEAARLLVEEGRRAVAQNRLEPGYRGLAEALDLFGASLKDSESVPVFIAAALDFASLSFSLGRDLGRAQGFLVRAGGLARDLGDRRSEALVNLHLGRIYYLGDRRLDAIVAFKAGQRLVEELGDEDIRVQASEFIGMNYFAMGLHGQAVEHLEQAAQAFEAAGDRLLNPSAPMYLGYCASYLGQFHRAVGNLDFAWRRARSDADKSLSSIYRATLGTVLLQIGQVQEGYYHIRAALSEAETSGNALAKYNASGGMAYYHFVHYRYKEAREILAALIREGAASGIRKQFASPYILEMLFEFERHGLEPIPDFRFADQAERILQEPSIHLQGVAWRLLARQRSIQGDHSDQVWSHLKKSEDHLILSGDPTQLAKTRAEMARFALGRGQRDQARQLALKARRGLSGHSEVFFPDELRALLKDLDLADEGRTDAESVAHKFRMIVGAIPSTSFDENMDFIVLELNRLLGAERGALFWADDRKNRELKLKTGRNLTEAETMAPVFERHWRTILRVFKEKRPVIERNQSGLPPHAASGARSVLCLPLVLKGASRGVLYYDNSYLTDCFDLLEDPLLENLAADLSQWVSRVIQFTGALEETERRAMEISVQRELSGRDEIVGGRSPRMLEALRLADTAAASESTILIQGETGVGKELLARRIHEKSPRAKKPLVTVDPTTIPENLTESELFGYEKGAFTGAEARKTGRVELAHQGTLFIDEITEIPLAVQTKLLRVLQEKTFVRIGGTQPQTSDFRLIVATNRDLESEVRAGRFRADLYYRLNIIKLEMPPLRERPEDVVVLARYFLARFSKKYNQPHLDLTRDHETMLTRYPWPGNVRELKNLIERAVILSDGQGLDLQLPDLQAAPAPLAHDGDLTLDEMQRRYIRHVLRKTGGRIGGPGGAAGILGLKRTSLYTRMKKLGLTRSDA
ncbi:MAG: sigma 54-interacting transcriptional regulator [Proteobacteria bacterium]|nr:sigma 54-interacting transcriptional regulator [Pseudomonadota bacterium]